MDIEPALVAHILSDEKITSIIQDRLFPLAVPQDEDVPAIVYQQISSPRTLTLTGESASHSRIQLSCYAKTFSQAKQMAITLYNSLDFFRGNLGNKTKSAVLMADSRDDYEPETGRYRCDVDFFIMHIKKKG